MPDFGLGAPAWLGIPGDLADTCEAGVLFCQSYSILTGMGLFSHLGRKGRYLKREDFSLKLTHPAVEQKGQTWYPGQSPWTPYPSY